MKLDIKKKLINHYNSLLQHHGFNEKGLGWRKEDLNERYELFLNHLSFKDKTILDYGCGLAHFFIFLKKKKIIFKNYYCWDINIKLKNFLKKKYYKNKKFNFVNNVNNQKKFDIILSNGVHNYNIKDIEKIFFKDLNFFMRKAKYAVGISFINDNVDYKENYLSYKNLYKVIRFLRKKNKLFILDQSYKKYETILIIFT